MATPHSIMEFIKKEKVQFLTLRFTDLLGLLQQMSYPVSFVDEDALEKGFGFDGSSIRCWKTIDQSDMLLVPDLATAKLDPFGENKSLFVTCTVKDPITGDFYDRDPRYVAQKLESYLKSTGIADTAYMGAEAEFFVFDSVQYRNDKNISSYSVDSIEGHWNTGVSGDDERANLGYKIPAKLGYVPAPPFDELYDVRCEMVKVMEQCGLNVECHHHEVSTAGQCEIDLKYNTLLGKADDIVLYKYIVRNVAQEYGLSVTFMPKPLFADNGSGMHTHQSLWKDGKPLFSGDGYAGLSELALHYMGGILKHAPALLALTNPSTNSYCRLVSGYEAPVRLAYSSRNRSACLRIPMYSDAPQAKRVEFRCPDCMANPYLAFSAMLLAGLDGIKNKIDPGQPMDKDIYSLTQEELSNIPETPEDLDAALDALEKDHDFLLQGNVFTQDLIDVWVAQKRSEAVERRMRPHPIEFDLYYGA